MTLRELAATLRWLSPDEAALRWADRRCRRTRLAMRYPNGIPQISSVACRADQASPLPALFGTDL